MFLTLNVIAYQDRPPESPLAMTFDEQGGGIGRAAVSDNRLHLPDPNKYISRKHGRISFDKGAFFFTDTSTGGTFCSTQNRSVHHDTIRLEDGDRLRIGDYELQISLADTAAASHTGADRLPPAYQDSDGDGIFFDTGTASDGESDSGSGDPFAWADGGLFDGPVESESFTPPSMEQPPAANEIPPDFDINQLLSDKEDTRPVTPPADPPSRPAPRGRNDGGTLPAEAPTGDPPRRSGENGLRLRRAIQQRPQPVSATERETAAPLLDGFLRAAGLAPEDILSGDNPEELLKTLGSLLRELIGGLMTVLQARSELKSQFRVSMTVIQPAENNPLKFSARSTDALKQLLNKDDRAFLDPISAVREGFEDIGNHQLALAAGIQTSLLELLKRFDPENFEAHFDRGLAIQRQSKSWKAYRDAYEGLVRETMEEIFGTAFSQAYEGQIQKLRSARNRNAGA